MKRYEANITGLPDDTERRNIVHCADLVLQAEGKERSAPSINDFYFTEKIVPNTVLIVGLGTNVRGNMQYILNELNHNDDYKDFKIYVRTKKSSGTDEIVNGYIKNNGWTRTQTVPARYNYYLESCQFLICESYFPYNWVKKPGQILIDTWHGTPLKCLGLLKNGRKCHLGSIQQKNFLCSDYLLYPNDYTKEKMLESYKIAPLLEGKALMLGYPRTCGLLSVSDERKAELMQILAPNGEHIYAYMPTFRGYMNNVKSMKFFKPFLEYIDKHLRDDQILYVNLHHKVNDVISYDGFTHVKKFPPLVDSYQLLSVAEALISDYSSVFFDFLPSAKQIILHLEDYDTYRTFQGLYMDVAELPFDKAYNAAEVVEALNRGKTYDDSEAIRRFCAYDSKDNDKNICKIMVGNTDTLTLEDHPPRVNRQVLIYSHGVKPGSESELLCEFMDSFASDKTDLYLGCDEDEVSLPDNLDSAYPMMFGKNVLASQSELHLSSIAEPIRELYLNGDIEFESAINVLELEYALFGRRAYGFTEFDSVIIYDAGSIDNIISLSLVKAKSRYLFITSEMIGQLINGSRFAKDAIIYAAAHCNGVFISNKHYRTLVETILGDELSMPLQIADSPELLSRLVEMTEDETVSSDSFEIQAAPVLPPMFNNKFMAHAFGEYNGYAYANNEAAFRNAVNNGYKFMEVDISLTTDGKIVCSHGWNKKSCEYCGIEYKPEYDNMTYDMFMGLNIHGEPALTAERLYQLMREFPHVYLELDLAYADYNETVSMVQQILEAFDYDADVFDRLLVQAKNFEMAQALKDTFDFPWTQIVITNSNIELMDDIIDFCLEMGINSVALRKILAVPANIKKLKDAGLAVLIFSSDDINYAKELLALGADTICTGKLLPDDLYSSGPYVFAYSSTPDAEEWVSTLIGTLGGKLVKAKNGSYVYDSPAANVGKNGRKLMSCCYAKDGFTFKGWKAKSRYDNKLYPWRWLCTDNVWRTKDEMKEGGFKAKIFAEEESVYPEMLQGRFRRIIFDAVWKQND